MKYLIYFRNGYTLHYGEILEQKPNRAKIRTPDGTEYFCDYSFICGNKEIARSNIRANCEIVMDQKLRGLEG